MINDDEKKNLSALVYKHVCPPTAKICINENPQKMFNSQQDHDDWENEHYIFKMIGELLVKIM